MQDELPIEPALSEPPSLPFSPLKPLVLLKPSSPPPYSPPSRFRQLLSTPRRKALAFFLVLVILGGWATQQVYSRSVDDPFVRMIARVFPFPALSVNGDTVSMKEFLAEYDALAQYFADQEGGAPPADQLEIAIADTLTNKMVIRQLATARGLEIDEARVEQYYQDVLASQESEEAFVQDLTETFGWSVDEFKTRVVESIVLALQMSEAILADEALQQSRRDSIDAAAVRVQGGEDFATVGKEVNAQYDAGFEADLGYVKLSIIPEAWASSVEALEIGSVTEVLDLTEGYAIFKAEDRITAADDTQIHLLSITVPKVTLEEVVKEYLETAEVKRYVGEI